MPVEGTNVKREDFVRWVNDYLLSESGLACNGDDLYGARCGLLHSYIAESTKSREGSAREINYLIGTSGRALVHVMTATPKPFIAVEIGQLRSAFLAAIGRFRERLKDDKDLAGLVHERAEHHFYEGTFLMTSPTFRYRQV